MHRQRNSKRLKFHLRSRIDFKSFSRFIYDNKKKKGIKKLVATPDATLQLTNPVSLFIWPSQVSPSGFLSYFSRFLGVQLKHRAGPPETDAG